jgi:hypothetical protein
MRERRAYRRFNTDLKSIYQAETGIIIEPHPGKVENLSLGGMLHAQPERLYPGQRITISFRPRPMGQVVLNGVVAWCANSTSPSGLYEAGIQWTHNSAASQARLAAFLAEHTEEPDVPAFTTTTTKQPIVWWRMITFGVLLFALLAVFDIFWLKGGNLYGERIPVLQAIVSMARSLAQFISDTWISWMPGSSENGL